MNTREITLTFFILIVQFTILFAQETAKEQRIVFPYYFNNESSATGSLTFAPVEGDPSLIGAFGDRPGDKVAMHLSQGGIIIWSGIGSELRVEGEMDLFGYEMRATEVGAADELAAGASLIMGQVAEGTPVVHVRGFPYPLREARLDEILRDIEADLFR